jgi:hypothetical protein
MYSGTVGGGPELLPTPLVRSSPYIGGPGEDSAKPL